MDVSTHLNAELTQAQAAAILELIQREWPQPDWDREAAVQGLLHPGEADDDASRYRREARRYVIWDGDRALAQAETFARTIRWESGVEKTVLALAGVVTDPNERGRGYGAAVVRAAFGRVDAGEFPAALFQTNHPGFYEKLGCRKVANRFADHRDRGGSNTSPWWNDFVLVYPADADWPHGPIDLNGPAY
ncbi:MAG: GNAT family N-acetyltransferase [Verrucomicrobiota bacterium]